MKRKNKRLVQLLIFVGLLLTLIGCFFVWDASKRLPLAVGDRVLLSRRQPGDLATIGLNLYNNGRRPITLINAHVSGTVWELSAAQMTSGLSYTEQPLQTWAAGRGAALTPVGGFRIREDGKATLGISLKRTSAASVGGSNLVVTYRLWFFTRQLQIALD